MPPSQQLSPRAGEVSYQITQAPRSSNDVPLWAFLVMTGFALILMCFVALLLWRPDMGFYLSFSKQRRQQQQQQQQQRRREKHHHHDKYHSDSQKGEEQQQQQQPQQQSLRHQPSQSSNSGRLPWFRGGSLRGDIDRWRRGVQYRESLLHSERAAAGAGSDDDVLAVVEAYRFAPHVAPRPISYLGGIPEYHYLGGGGVGGVGGDGIKATMPMPAAVARTAATTGPVKASEHMQSSLVGAGMGALSGR